MTQRTPDWRRLRGALAALCVPLLMVAGCGGGSSDPSATPTASKARETALAAPAGTWMATPWTNTALQAAVPLPEYPRPQMTRPDWINLNGMWQYQGGTGAPDAANPPAAAPAFPANPQSVRVPFPVESYLSGIQRMNERNLWYKRSFTVPSGWSGRRTIPSSTT